jgi:hypothetical protein
MGLGRCRSGAAATISASDKTSEDGEFFLPRKSHKPIYCLKELAVRCRRVSGVHSQSSPDDRIIVVCPEPAGSARLGGEQLGHQLIRSQSTSEHIVKRNRMLPPQQLHGCKKDDRVNRYLNKSRDLTDVKRDSRWISRLSQKYLSLRAQATAVRNSTMAAYRETWTRSPEDGDPFGIVPPFS